MRIFRSTKDGDERTWVNVDSSEKGKTTSQRVTLANEVPEEEWIATKNRFIDYVDIDPPTREEMELVEDEITVSEDVFDKNGKLVFPAVKRKIQTLRIDN